VDNDEHSTYQGSQDSGIDNIADSSENFVECGTYQAHNDITIKEAYNVPN
jgi:hypothetical protein